MKKYIKTIELLIGLIFILPSLAQAKTLNNQVTALGYHGITYGQKIDKTTLKKAGLTLPNNANSTCYYIPITNTQAPRSTLMQVIDNRLGLVQVKDNSVPVFSSIKIGDKVSKVLQNNRGLPTYEVDKYDDGKGSNYHLIYTLPNDNQIKYTMTGGSKMPSNTIESKNWHPTAKSRLTGKVQSISVGKSAAIALVEGCS